jgi:hypothetical protein
LLLKTKVYETDGIIVSLEHTLLGETIIVEVNKTKLHIEESPENLNLLFRKIQRIKRSVISAASHEAIQRDHDCRSLQQFYGGV